MEGIEFQHILLKTLSSQYSVSTVWSQGQDAFRKTPLGLGSKSTLNATAFSVEFFPKGTSRSAIYQAKIGPW